MGVGGAIGVGIVFWNFALLSKAYKLYFYFVSFLFCIYAASLLVLPNIELFSFQYTDQDLFFAKIGIPIQMIRTIIIFITSISLWLFHENIVNEELTEQQKIRKIKIGRGTVFLFFLVAVGGWFLCSYLGNYAKYRSDQLNNDHIASLNGNLESFLTAGNDLSIVLSGSPFVISALSNPTAQSIVEVNTVLDRYSKVTNVSICYLLDKDGNTIATSNRNAADSLLGKNYAFRPYFFEARQGKHSTYFAVGVTTYKPGYYTSNPVHDANGNIIGVSVVKMDLTEIQNHLKNYNYSFLTSPEGVIFLSSQEKYLYQSIGPLTYEEKRKLYDSQQFNNGKFEPLFDKRLNNGDKIKLDNDIYDVNITDVNNIGWSLVLLTSAEVFVVFRLLGIAITLIVFIILLSVIVTIQYIRRNKFSSYFAAAVYAASDAIVGKDLDGKITSWNHGAESIYGYSKDEVLGKNVSILFAPDKVEENLAMLKNISKGNKINNFETQQIRKDRQFINVSLTISAIEDSSGEIIGASMVARDITKQKQVEESLRLEKEKISKVQENLEIKNKELEKALVVVNNQKRKAEETKAAFVNLMEDLNIEREEKMAEGKKYEALLTSIGDGIVATDRSGRIMIVNNEFENMSGFTHEELVNKIFYDVVKAEDVKGKIILPEERDISIVSKTGEKVVRPLNNPIVYVRKDNSKLPVAVTTSPVQVGKNLLGYIVVVRDISREYTIDKAKTEFVSLASHQLRTPLTAISWFTEMLLRKTDNLNKYQKEYLNEIYQSGRRMAELVNSLLNVSRIEMGTFAIEPKDCSLKEIAKNVITDLELLFKKKKIKLKETYDAKLPHISGDPQLINIIFLNLLSNAIKYTRPIGKVSLEISLKKGIDFPNQKLGKEFNNCILIKVSDDGVGIPKNDQPKIFSKLYRADNAKILDPAGSGLGLYIVKAILDNSGGKIWFESIENKGTKFYVIFPLSGMIKKEGSKILL